MGLLDWFSRASKNNDDKGHAPAEFDKGEEEFHGLNMKTAIDAHVKWKERLVRQLSDSSSEMLEITRVATDSYCELGKWLHDEGKKRFSHTNEYKQLIRSHADFHLFAGEILMDIRSGDKEIAEKKLRTEFRRKSDRVQLDLVRLYATQRAAK